MKSRLSDADYQRVLACIEAIHSCRVLEKFPQHVLAELRKLIDCNLAGYNEVNLPENRIVVVLHLPQLQMDNSMVESFGKLMQEHPVITYFDQTGDGQALMISDFLTAREFHQRAIYRDFYRRISAEDQISFSVRIAPNFMIGIAFNRDRRSFTEKDRLILNLLRPHIAQAYLYAAELTGHHERQHDLHTVLRENGLGVIAVNTEGRVVHSTPGVFECLARYLPVPQSPTPTLPSRVVEWMRETKTDGTDAPFILRQGTARLIVRCPAGQERRLLLVSEDSGVAVEQRLARYALTPREQEVLLWLSEGKSNAEIALILGLTAGTVKLHVERILTKLGVDNRTIAALIVHGVHF